MLLQKNADDLPGAASMSVRPDNVEANYKKVTTKSRHRRSILKALIFIENNLGQPIKLEDLSAVACLSSFHFHRLFASYMRETVNEYICRRRMEIAAMQLAEGESSITDIGLSNGYSTPAAFAKTFKRFTGQSPSDYKKRFSDKSTGNFLLDQIFLRGMRSKESRYLTDIEPIIRHVPDRYALMIKKKGFFSGSFKHVIWEGLKELYQYINQSDFSESAGSPVTACERFPKGVDDPEAEISVGIMVEKEFEPDNPFFLTKLEGGRYAVYEYYEPARLYKLTWEVYWHWQKLKRKGIDKRFTYQMLAPSTNLDLAIYKKILHVPIEPVGKYPSYASPGLVRNRFLKYDL